MYRSFTDRVLGGVCGGLAAIFPISAWWFRAAFIILTLVTLGAFALLYVALWWLLPQESLVRGRSGGAGYFLILLLLTILTGVGYYAHFTGTLKSQTGSDLFWPAAALVLAAIFFLRQVRA